MTRRRMVLLALFGVLVLIKIPSVLAGRLWAEDGLFLIDALSQPWWLALTTSHTGYIDVTASATMLFATRVVDLSHVGMISVLCAWIIQVCPAILLATSNSTWLRSPWVLLIAFLLMLVPPVTEEVWLSPVTSQYHLMVCTALILAFDGRLREFRYVILAIAGLTGPGPILIAPLFALRAGLERSRHRLIQTITLSTGAMIEFIIFCGHPVPDRHLVIDPSLLANIIYVKHLVLPFFGRWAATQSGVNPQPLIVLLSGLTLAVLTLKAQGREVRWLYAAAIVMMVMSYFGALGTKTDLLNAFFGARYYYAPQVLLSLTLLGIACTGQPVMASRVVWGLVGWLLLVGGSQYFEIDPMMATGPSWHDQVVMGDRPIRLWPVPMQIDLYR